MVWVAFGAGVLFLLLFSARAFAEAPVEKVRQALVWLAAGIGVLLLAALLISGRGGQAFWSLVLFGPVVHRWWRNWLANRRFSQGQAPGESAVQTATLDMRLDHASGRMSGRVRRGDFAGRELAELGLPELLALLRDCQAHDEESIPLLEAWLDRIAPDWREADAGAAPAGDGRMDRAEALQVLGLAEGATEAEIRTAHRRLMQAAHPDHGGSDWLAARINRARDLLLGQS